MAGLICIQTTLLLPFDDNDRFVAQKRLPNELSKIVCFLRPLQGQMSGVVIEPTYNWHWLGGWLAGCGLPCAACQHGGDQAVRLKHGGDDRRTPSGPPVTTEHLPTGTILPRKHRAVPARVGGCRLGNQSPCCGHRDASRRSRFWRRACKSASSRSRKTAC